VTTLLSVPNVSEGRDRGRIDQIARAFGARQLSSAPQTRLLNIHSDPDHNRSVYTLAGEPGSLADAVVRGAHEAIALIDMNRHQGAHPNIGAIDVAPIVYLGERDRGAAVAEALVLADRIGEELALPVFLYGVLAGGRTRAELRRGGGKGLAKRIADGELRSDFGPPTLHPTAGAVLIAARPPLIAFNVELAPPAKLEDAKEIAAATREGGSDGLESVRAIGVWLEHRHAAQVSMNVEDYVRAPLARVIETIARRAPIGEAELVGLAPRAAFDGFPDDVIVRNRATIEEALASSGSH
jgi:glutamate formiminotransferase / 5-formyltetrahydrofolate cyclo-ligase